MRPQQEITRRCSKQVLENAGAAGRARVLGQHENSGLLSSAAGQGYGVCERLSVSQVSRLNEQTLILIAYEVLGRQGLRKEWYGLIST